ncbi:GNAT family N-acetyltransferase [Flavobacterium adhaerens]|uniref:GNAT family N-acetyltransferase n=1 Tax=Flavobacterium adhaerens TaxID=3149043 RepID=UPI0032B508DB
MNYSFRKATIAEIPEIWEILQQAILRRKQDGSQQWQDGYPNPTVVQNDINKGAGFVLTEGETIVGYTAILINDEPEYANIKGKWLSNDDFVVFHRVALSEKHIGKGLAKKIFEFIEEFANQHQVYSIKADTNFDNVAMLKIFEKMGYVLCGKVYFRGGERLAFEKILPQLS